MAAVNEKRRSRLVKTKQNVNLVFFDFYKADCNHEALSHVYSFRVQLVKELLQELDLGVLQSGKDSGKRADPTDKGSKTYTKKEFVAFYGPQKGEIMWNLAGRTAKGGKGGKGGKGVCPQTPTSFIKTPFSP